MESPDVVSSDNLIGHRMNFEGVEDILTRNEVCTLGN